MDIQKLRTPKGLIWLSQKFPSVSHNQLLMEMQGIRKIHCTIWAETVKEIVSAKNSKVKFIVSDHPVTVFNPACPPGSIECKYPNDPRIEMKGTQTIFPFDSNRCLILTNLDYAQNPSLKDHKRFRPNPNPFRNTLVRYDNIINDRELSEEEVSSINWIIKSRASQYLAAEKKEWLFPEKTVQVDWADSGKVLMPPIDELYKYGGEVYVGYEDGSSSYQDQYGRTRPEWELLKKKKIDGKIGANDPCPCGSGKKYKKCCKGKPEDERPASPKISELLENGIATRFWSMVRNGQPTNQKLLTHPSDRFLSWFDFSFFSLIFRLSVFRVGSQPPNATAARNQPAMGMQMILSYD